MVFINRFHSLILFSRGGINAAAAYLWRGSGVSERRPVLMSGLEGWRMNVLMCRYRADLWSPFSSYFLSRPALLHFLYLSITPNVAREHIHHEDLMLSLIVGAAASPYHSG